MDLIYKYIYIIYKYIFTYIFTYVNICIVIFKYKNLNSITFRRKRIEGNLQDLRLGIEFLDLTPKA